MKHRIPKWMAVLTCITLLGGSLAACGGSPTSEAPTEAGTEQPAASETGANDESTAGNQEAAAGGSLVIYTNSGGDGRGEWLTELAAEAGYDISIMHLGGGDLTNRAIAEKNNQVADVVFGLNPMEFERMKRENLLAVYQPAWSGEVDAALADSEGMYYPIVIQPLVMAYNTDVYTEAEMPARWEQLGTNPEFAGKYTVLSLGGATSRCILVGILDLYRDDEGEHGISDEGWDVMRQFIQNGYIQQEGDDWFGACVDGERPITEIWGSGLLQNIEEMGIDNVDYAMQETGTPFIVEQVAIFENANNPALAREFVDWFGTAEVQAAWSAQFGTIPANEGAVAHAAPEVQDMVERAISQDIDWMFASEMLEIWVEKIELEFVL